MPFPYVKSERVARRPALVIGHPVGPDRSLIWLAMITSARARQWPGDVATGANHAAFGLPVPCFVRTAKLVTLQIGDIDGYLGRLPEDLMQRVRAEILSVLT